MNSRVMLAYICALFFVLPAACASAPYTDGTCGEPSDCPAASGTVCNWKGLCKCPRAGDELCCPGGLEKCGDEYSCRPAEECKPVTIPSAVETRECETAADCMKLAPELDVACGSVECVDFACAITVEWGKEIASDYPGDCKRAYCDIMGRVVELMDPGDVPFDANPCTFDRCVNGSPTPEVFPDTMKCPDMDSGICVLGECVECALVLGEIDCPSGRVCDGTACVPPHCIDSFDGVNGDETSPNCGGSCVPCSAGQTCAVDADCMSNHCVGIVCAPSLHDDKVKNDGETGKDCGCLECTKKCEDGEGCNSETDCVSAVCYAGVCQTATCIDATKNGTETGTDCGGSCPLPCLE